MTPPVLSSEPLVVAAGETMVWSRTIANYLASDGWVPKYYFAGADAFQLAGSQSGNGWNFTLTADATKTKTPGTYRWILFAEKGTAGVDLQRYRICEGALDLTPNITTANPGDFQTHEERTYTILKAAVEGRLTADIENYQVAGKAVSKIPMKQLHALMVVYAWKVWRQKNPGQIGAKVGVAFFPPDGTIGAPEPVILPPFYRYGG